MYAVSHMVIFTSTKKRNILELYFKKVFINLIKNSKLDNYVRYIKNPDGPTLTFKIISYSDKK